MNRKEITAFLSYLLETRLSGIGKYSAREVTLDYGSKNERRIDYLEFEPPNQMSISSIEKGIFTCYEVKSCKEDVFSGNGLNFIGEKNYIVTTMQCWKDIQDKYRSGELEKHIKSISAENSSHWGIMVAVPVNKDSTDEFFNPTPIDDRNIDQWELRVIKPCYIGLRKRSITELLFYMLRSRTNKRMIRDDINIMSEKTFRFVGTKPKEPKEDDVWHEDGEIYFYMGGEVRRYINGEFVEVSE